MRKTVIRTFSVLIILIQISLILPFISNYECYATTHTRVEFSDAETEWLASHSTVRIGVIEDYMPFCDIDAEGNVDGVVSELLDQISSILNLQNKVSAQYIGYNSFPKMAEGLKNGEIDMSFPASGDKNFLYEMGINGTLGTISVPFYVAYIGAYNDKTFSTIALSSRPIAKIKEEYSDSEIKILESSGECLDSVINGDATCAVMSSYRLKELLNNPKYRAINTMPFGASMNYCVGVASNNGVLLSILNKGIIQLDKAVITDSIFKYIEEGKQYTFRDFLQDNMVLVSFLVMAVIAVLVTIFSLYLKAISRAKQETEIQLDNVNILAALSEGFESIYVADLDEKTIRMLKVYTNSGTSDFNAPALPYFDTVSELVDKFVEAEYQKDFIDFLDLEQMKKRMEEETKFTYRYAMKKEYSDNYMYEVAFVKVGNDAARHQLVIGRKCIDDILKIEREEGQYVAALLHDCVFFYGFDVTDGMISGEFSSKNGYNPLFGLELEFPIKYDDFNAIRTREFGINAITEKEAGYWTCKGLFEAYENGNRTVLLRYASEDLEFFWDATIILTEDELSHHLHAVYICKDVTETVEAEQSYKRKIEKALLEAQRANAAKSEFLSRMSHDIRTPLNGIIGLLEISEMHHDNIELLDANRKKARIAANHLLGLINDVLDMSKLEDKSVELPVEPFDIGVLGREVMEICDVKAKENGITPISDNGVNIKFSKLYGSPLHLKQILLNVVNNGIKYNKPGGTIFCGVELRHYDEETVVYDFIIKDTGIGISKEFIDHLYMPFTQEKNDARSHYQGTGLGMAIVKTLTEKMNGEVRCESEVGVGTTFTITIPFKIDHSANNNEKVNTDNAENSIEDMNILLVEDNELNMEIAVSILDDFGAKIETAENGQVAVDKYLNNKAGTFDAILMDIMMPVLDGYGASCQIRKSDKEDAASIPIIAMTANAFTEDVQKAMEAGMTEHLSKPIEINTLIRVLSKYRKRN